MKIKPSRDPGGVLVELGPNEREIPCAVKDAEEEALRIFKIKRILVPIDFSPCSKKALQYAVPLAKQFGASLCLLYVGEGYYLVPEAAAVDLATIEERARADAAGRLAQLGTEEIANEVPVDILVRKGHARTEILRAARELPADLIIISTHGYTGLKHICLGSITEGVVRQAACPVLVVREQEHEFV